MFLRRNLREKLEKALAVSPVVLLTGARQTGKTTLMQEVARDKNYTYVTFDSLTTLAAAKSDPEGFIAQLSKPVILDEVQRIPEIFLAIKLDVDKNRVSGRFALTGSANPLLIPRLGDTLAGRMRILDLFPLSQGELHGIFDDFIDMIFTDQFKKPTRLSKKELLHRMMIGGFPTVQGLDSEARNGWFDDYITTILTREVKELADVAGITEFPKLLRLLATRAGGLFNGAELSRASGLVTTTLSRYLALLETVFMIYFLQPWSVNLGKRLIKSPKQYLVDTGLLSSLLGLTEERLMHDPMLIGSLLENFIVGELIKQASWSKRRVHLYHYRTSDGEEVDIIIEDQAGGIIGIEIKGAETVTGKDFKGLRYLQEAHSDRFVKGIVLYTGHDVVPFGNNLFAYPVSQLWAGE